MLRHIRCLRAESKVLSGNIAERTIRTARMKEAREMCKKAAGFFDGGELDKAELEWKAAVDLLKSKSAGLGQDLVILEPLNNLACAVGELGRAKEKLKLLDEHAGLVEKLYGRNHPQYVVSAYNRASALGDVGRPTEMKKEMSELLHIQKEVLTPPERRGLKPTAKVARLMLGKADACGRRGDFQERLDLLSEALPIVESHCGQEHPQVAAVNLALSDASLDLFYSSFHSSSSSSFSACDSSMSPHSMRALNSARKAFAIESKIIPTKDSHLLTHSRLALARSRAALNYKKGKEEGEGEEEDDLIGFLGDIGHDVRRHTGPESKLLIPILSFTAKYQLMKNMTTSKKSIDSAAAAASPASDVAEMSYQISLRHFDPEGHIEIPQKMLELAAILNLEEQSEKAKRFAQEAHRLFSSCLKTEDDFLPLVQSEKLLEKIETTTTAGALERDILRCSW